MARLDDPITFDCPNCGGLVAFNTSISPVSAAVNGAVTARLSIKPDDLTVRRHKDCGIIPTGPGERRAS